MLKGILTCFSSNQTYYLDLLSPPPPQRKSITLLLCFYQQQDPVGFRTHRYSCSGAALPGTACIFDLTLRTSTEAFPHGPISQWKFTSGAEEAWKRGSAVLRRCLKDVGHQRPRPKCSSVGWQTLDIQYVYSLQVMIRAGQLLFQIYIHYIGKGIGSTTWGDVRHFILQSCCSLALSELACWVVVWSLGRVPWSPAGNENRGVTKALQYLVSFLENWTWASWYVNHVPVTCLPLKQGAKSEGIPRLVLMQQNPLPLSWKKVNLSYRLAPKEQ